MEATETKTEVLQGNLLENFFSDTKPEETHQEETPQTITDFFTENKGTKQPEIKEEVVNPQETVQATATSKVDYTDLIKDMIETGDWVDGGIETTNEKGETVTVNLSDLKDVDKDTFLALKAEQKRVKEEEFSSKYISIEGLDESTRKMIELKKAGGDITPLLQIQAQHVNPLNNLDLDDEAIQEGLVRQKYAYQGIDEDIIDAKIQKLKAGLQLDIEAKKIAEEVNTNFEKKVEAELEIQKQTQVQHQAEQKEFKKKITESYRALNLSDTLIKNLVESGTKTDELGLSTADKAYFEAKNNPELYAEINFLLTNKEKYDEFKGTKIKNDVTKETVKNIFRLTPKTTSTAAVEKPEDKVQEFMNSK